MSDGHSTVLLFAAQAISLSSLLYEHELSYFTESEAYDGFTVNCGITTAAV